MRITSYITVSGERTLTRLLVPDIETLKDISPDGKFDESMARKALANLHGITLASDDCRSVYAFALQAIEYAHDIMRQLVGMAGSSDHAVSKLDNVCERRMESGKRAFARIDIKRCGDRLRVRVDGGNPLHLVGHVDNQVFETCVFWAYVVLLIKRNAKEAGQSISIVEGEGARGAIAAAEKKLIENELYHKASTCERRRCGGFCSPADPYCLNFDCGKCKVKLFD